MMLVSHPARTLMTGPAFISGRWSDSYKHMQLDISWAFAIEYICNVPTCIHILLHSWGVHCGLDHMTTACF